MDADRPPGASVHEAIREAELLLPGVPVDEDDPDPRWHAIIRVAEYIETHPEEIWSFTWRWGIHEQEDLRSAIACCILEHLLGFDFATFFPRVQTLARSNANFADTFRTCWKFGQAEETENAKAWDALLAEIREQGREPSTDEE